MKTYLSGQEVYNSDPPCTRLTLEYGTGSLSMGSLHDWLVFSFSALSGSRISIPISYKSTFTTVGGFAFRQRRFIWADLGNNARFSPEPESFLIKDDAYVRLLPGTATVSGRFEVESGRFVSVHLESWLEQDRGSDSGPAIAQDTSIDGRFSADLSGQLILGSLPPGVTCRSGSGVFPGCDNAPMQAGTIVVTTNLSSAAFAFVGPVSHAGQASYTHTNAPPGTYTITYGAVPGYATPPSETRTLAAGGTISFTGSYLPLLPQLTVAPGSLSFNYLTSTIGPIAAQQLNVSSNGAAVSFNATVSAGSGNWLFMQPASGTTPRSLYVSVSPNLQPGVYNGSIVISSAETSNTPVSVPVALTVSRPQLLVSPSTLQFSSVAGSQSLLVSTSDGSQIQFAAQPSSEATSWLAVEPRNATTPISLQVSIRPNGLAAGVYTSSVLMSSADAMNSVSVPVTLTFAGCSDERDSIIDEYRRYLPDFLPTCGEFTKNYRRLSTGDYDWALVRTPMLEGLRTLENNIGAVVVNSAYRNPVRNRGVSGSAGRSRHMFGDAIDVNNPTRTLQGWQLIYQAALEAGADWLEGQTSKYPCRCTPDRCVCVHADWRSSNGGYVK
ncbi:MAG: hypothetical protein K1X67_15135 [Fimbriimonadaceae bacterium]|nr:hypothetical protein [Fimbriimonadaceae bacterium]